MKRSAFSALLVSFALVAMAAPPKADPLPTKRLKMRIAIAPTEGYDGSIVDQFNIPVEFRNALDEKLAKRLFDTGRFIVLERQALEAILQEKAITQEATGKPGKKIVPAYALVKNKLTNFQLNRRGGGGGVNVGGFGRIGGSQQVAEATINVRIFDSQTTEMLYAEEAKGDAKSTSFGFSDVSKLGLDFKAFDNSPLGKALDTAINKSVDLIVRKMATMPWQANIASVEDGEIMLTAGSDAGVQVGDTFDVYSLGKAVVDPETGEILGRKSTKIGKVRVESAEKRFSTAKVIEGKAPKAGDIVKEVV